MKTNFDIDTYLRAAEENFSVYDVCDDGCYGYTEIEEEPVFNRKRILLLCR